MNGISKLLMRKGAHVPSDPPNSPYLPPDLPPRNAQEDVAEQSNLESAAPNMASLQQRATFLLSETLLEEIDEPHTHSLPHP